MLILFTGDIAAAIAAAKVDKSSDDKGKVAAEIEAPKVVVKPRRDRKVLLLFMMFNT